MAGIKICGLSRPEDIAAVNEVLPDYAGFVFAGSRRQVTEERAMELRALLNPAIKSVGIFVNDAPERIWRLCERNILDLIQLHGEEGEDYIAELRRRTDKPIIKALRVGGREEQKPDVEKYPSDYLLFDTYRKEQYGGSGESFDWSLMPHTSRPYFLAGGIHIGNVEQAILQCRPYCVDVSSGVETDGYKDAVKILEIVKKIRSIGKTVT
jgi:phosphoribosylanthranilate isomerase